MWIEGYHNHPPERSALERLAEPQGFLSDADAQIWFANFCKSNLYFTTKLLMGVELDLYQEIKLRGFFLRDFCCNIEGRGVGKSFTISIFIVLYAIFNPGVKIGICSGTFRQSKLIFKQIEKFIDHKDGKFLKQCVRKISHDPDGYTMYIGQSTIMAVPLTEKIRGLRFNKVIVDEYLLVPKDMIESVIGPFMTAKQSDGESDKIRRLEDELIGKGLMTEEERRKMPNNSMIVLSSACFKFENLYKDVFLSYCNLVLKKDAAGINHFVFRLSYEAVMGFGRLDMKYINTQRLQVSSAQFDKEYRAIFGDEGSGYFSHTTLESATIPTDCTPSLKMRGDRDKKYLLAIDPNYSESEHADHFAMAVIELDEAKESGVLVHAYALANSKLSKRSAYLNYLLTYFNIVYIIVDNSGGPKFLSDAEQFLSGFNLYGRPVSLKEFPETFLEGEEGLREARKAYNLPAGRIVHSQIFGKNNWIRLANETLVYHLEHGKIRFGGALGDRGFEIVQEQNIPVEDLEFAIDTGTKEKMVKGEQLWNFADHLNSLIKLTKQELMLIEVNSNPSGHQTFDLASEAKRNKKDPTRARRDSYTALLLASYGMHCYFQLAKQSFQQEIIMPVRLGVMW